MSDRARIACLPAPGRLVAVSLVLSCVTSPARAQVEVDSRTAAKVFSTEGRELAAAGNYEQACPKFERSVNLEPGVGTRFELADCWEHLGRTASAFKLFRDVADVAKEAGDESLERDARARVTALEPKLSRVVVTVEHPAPGIEVRRGSSALPEKFWGTPLPVDPGHTEVSAAAPGKQTWSRELDVPSAPGSVLEVRIPELTDERVPPKAAVAKSDPASKGESRGIPTTALVIGGVGIGAIALGIVGAVEYRSKNDDAKNVCPTSYGCTAKELSTHDELVDDARTARNVAYLGFALGGVALAGAATIYFVQSAGEGGTSVQAGARIAPDGSWRAVVRGNF